MSSTINNLTLRSPIDYTENVALATPGANWKAPLSSFVRNKLTANANFFVAVTGNDSNPGTALLPWATPQHAYDFITSTFDFGGFAVAVTIGAGTYTDVAAVTRPSGGSAILTIDTPWPGGGFLGFVGDIVTPSNVVFNVNTHVSFGCLVLAGSFPIPGAVSIDGIKVEGSTLGAFGIGNLMSGYTFQIGNVAGTGNFEFGAFTGGGGNGAHILVSAPGAEVEINNNYTISGGAGSHILSQSICIFYNGSGTGTLTGTPNFTDAFITVRNNSIVWLDGEYFSGSATGKQFDISTNSLINTDLAGPTVIPGNVAGTIETGGVLA